MAGFQITDINFRQGGHKFPAGKYTFGMEVIPNATSITFGWKYKGSGTVNTETISDLTIGVRQYRYKTFTATDEIEAFYPARQIGAKVFKPTLNKGDKPIDPSASSDDVSYSGSQIKVLKDSISLKVSGDDLLDTGIDITNKKIEATTNQFNIKANNGTPIAVFKLDANGNPVLKAQNIEFDGAKGNNVELTGKITAGTGAIGPFVISPGSLVATSSPDSMLLSSGLIRFMGSNSSVFIGADTFPASGGGAILATQRISISRNVTNSLYGNIGSYYSIEGSTAYDDDNLAFTGNHALYIPKGSMTGVRFRTRRVSGTKYLNTMDTNIIVVANNTTIWLPNNPEDGQMYWINPGGYSNVIVKSYQDIWQNTNQGKTSHIGDRVWNIFIYDKKNSMWLKSWMNS